MAGRARILAIIGIPVLLLVGVILAVSLLGGGDESGGGGSSSGGKGGGTFTLGMDQDPDTLDPQKTNLDPQILLYLGDPLVTKTPGGKIVPALAESWKVSEDGKVYTFKLKNGVKFHDGTPLDAEAVKASIERALDPKTKAGIAASLFAGIESVEAPSKDTVEVKLAQPSSIFLLNISAPPAAIINVEAANRMGDEFGRKPVLSGPYEVESWKSGEQVVIKRNPDYRWAPDYVKDESAYLDTITFRIIPDLSTQVSALRSGELQAIRVPPVNVGEIRGSDEFRTFENLRQGIGTYIEMNTQRAPFDDPAVREAISHAVDKEAIIDSVYRGQGEPACGPLPSTIPGYWEGACDAAPGHDPAKAKELLSGAGWNPGQDGTLQKNGQPLEFTLLTQAGNREWSQSAQLIQQQLKGVGVKMEIQSLELGALIEKVGAGESQANFLGYSYTNPDILYQFFHSSSIEAGLNTTRIQSDELDAVLEKMRSAADAAERDRFARQAQETLIDEAAWVPIVVNQDYWAARQEVRGAEVGADGSWYLQNASVSE